MGAIDDEFSCFSPVGKSSGDGVEERPIGAWWDQKGNRMACMRRCTAIEGVLRRIPNITNWNGCEGGECCYIHGINSRGMPVQVVGCTKHRIELSTT